MHSELCIKVLLPNSQSKIMRGTSKCKPFLGVIFLISIRVFLWLYKTKYKSATNKKYFLNLKLFYPFLSFFPFCSLECVALSPS